MTAISITSMLSEKHAMNRAHPEAVNERLRMITFLVTSEPEKYLKNRWELKRMAIMETLNLTPAEYGYTTEAINREAKTKRNAEILRLHGDGLSGRAIAKELGIPQQTVSDVIRRRLDD